jgi:PQQ-dependent dehydrogenase (methanol/ethanol family)
MKEPRGTMRRTTKHILFWAGLAAFAAVAASKPASPPKTASSNSDLVSLSADDSQWVMPAKNYASTRFSGLNQINTSNVGQLRVAWTFALGSDHGQEAAPLVVDGIIYVVGPYPNPLFALDAVTGDLKWKYVPNTDPSSQGVACCDVINRGAAYDNGKIFFNTLDNHTVAVDAKTGKEVWATKLGEISRGQTLTMAPLVVKGKILVGNSGGEMGVRGWLTALDESTGKVAWRAYSTGPDKDVLIGSDFKSFYKQHQGKDLGVSSWPPGRWQNGGGPVWGWISYDPALNLIYYGTGNPGPWNSNQRPGDNLWTSTIFARDPDTGAAKWAYQASPHDLWDYDEINESILADLSLGGRMRQVLIHPGRNGFMYVMDRTTGEVLSADAYDLVTSYTSFDLKTGRPTPNSDLTPLTGKNIMNVCPAAPGAKDWQPSAYSPRTQMLYVPHQHLCMDFKTSEVGYIAGTPYVGATVDMYAGPGGYRGEFMAWDPVQRKKTWAIKEKFPVWSGALVTAGDVAFYGTLDRWFRAVDARNGKLLWQFHAGSGFVGQPITYRGSDGTQYIAVLAGVGGWPGAIANSEIDPRSRNGALGFNGATQDLPAYTAGGGELLVFALPNTNPAPAAGNAPLR